MKSLADISDSLESVELLEDVLEDCRYQGSNPIKEGTSGTLGHEVFPISDLFSLRDHLINLF